MIRKKNITPQIDNCIEYRDDVGNIYSGISALNKDNRSRKVEIIRKTVVQPMPELKKSQVEKLNDHFEKLGSTGLVIKPSFTASASEKFTS